jgi:hypothetical protein
MAKPLTDILKDINADLKNVEKYIPQKNALSIIFQYAYDADKKWLLPEGDPPYKPSAEPLGMTPTNLYTELRRFYVYARADLKPLRREQLFVEFLESIHPDEAKLILAIKEQDITSLYPKLTRQWAESMRLILPLPVEEKVAKEPKAPKTKASKAA